MNGAATGCADLCAACYTECGCLDVVEYPRSIEFVGRLRLLDDGPCRYRVEQREGQEFYVIIDGQYVILPCDQMQTDLGSIPRPVQMVIPKDKYKNEFVLHDALFFYRYVLVSRGCGVGPTQRKYLNAAAMIQDEDERLHILGPAFNMVTIRLPYICDNWLDRLIAAKAQTGYYGTSRIALAKVLADRAAIRSGLMLGSWWPWFVSKREKRNNALHKHPVLLTNMRVEEAIG